MAVSLNYTNHLYDIPMMKTYVNAYGDSTRNTYMLWWKN